MNGWLAKFENASKSVFVSILRHSLAHHCRSIQKRLCILCVIFVYILVYNDVWVSLVSVDLNDATGKN